MLNVSKAISAAKLRFFSETAKYMREYLGKPFFFSIFA